MMAWFNTQLILTSLRFMWVKTGPNSLLLLKLSWQTVTVNENRPIQRLMIKRSLAMFILELGATPPHRHVAGILLLRTESV